GAAGGADPQAALGGGDPLRRPLGGRDRQGRGAGRRNQVRLRHRCIDNISLADGVGALVTYGDSFTPKPATCLPGEYMKSLNLLAAVALTFVFTSGCFAVVSSPLTGA